LSLEIEKPAAGGRMIARHEGQVVFVSGAIPGERVRARITNVRGGVGYADATDVERPSPDRRTVQGDPACGGMVYAHVRYERQLQLKSEIIADAFARLGRLPLDTPIDVRPSPEAGYRMRARLHVRAGHAGFFREGTHELCDAGVTGQLLPATAALVGSISERLRAGRIRDLRAIELSENLPATERALLVEASPESGAAAASRALAVFDDPGVTGVGIMRGRHPLAARGEPYVHDVLRVEADGDAAAVSFRRHAGAFFQGNRFLLSTLAAAVVARLPRGRLVELYAGSGLFGLSFAALGRGDVTAVEGDEVAGEDLRENAAPYADRVLPVTVPVEEWVSRSFSAPDATVLVDPPRTGMSAEASGAVARSGAPRIVYVSCDVATLARDARRFADAGYRLTAVDGFDLFPNTAHVETVVVFDR
jgi:tRNA/tmRNA/rRNA uracil-C5-methylase (TrmA/RlmC/RlmD family)